MIALPDFGAGAMENWGLITYREKYVLYDSAIFSLKDRQRVTNIIAHELAHMVWLIDDSAKRTAHFYSVVRRPGYDEVVGRYLAK
jgi:hypothetical protein